MRSREQPCLLPLWRRAMSPPDGDPRLQGSECMGCPHPFQESGHCHVQSPWVVRYGALFAHIPRKPQTLLGSLVFPPLEVGLEAGFTSGHGGRPRCGL